jgi:hypothetical protein
MDDRPENARVLRVGDLLQELVELPVDAPVLIAVCKYPSDHQLTSIWDEGDAYEVVPLEEQGIVFKGNEVLICAELTDFQAERDSLTT